MLSGSTHCRTAGSFWSKRFCLCSITTMHSVLLHWQHFLLIFRPGATKSGRLYGVTSESLSLSCRILSGVSPGGGGQPRRGSAVWGSGIMLSRDGRGRSAFTLSQRKLVQVWSHWNGLTLNCICSFCPTHFSRWFLKLGANVFRWHKRLITWSKSNRTSSRTFSTVWRNSSWTPTGSFVTTLRSKTQPFTVLHCVKFFCGTLDENVWSGP